MTVYYERRETPLGKVLLAASDDDLIGLWFEGQKYEATPDAQWMHRPSAAVLQRAARQLDGYFSGQRKAFDLQLDLRGTDFQCAVWRQLQRIPFGQTLTYGQLAAKLGRPAAVRAAAAAVGRNPVSVVVPCHRVLGSDGSLTGYAGGLDKKQALLQIEGLALPLAGAG